MRRILLLFFLLLSATAPCGAAPSKDAAKPPTQGAASGSMAAPGAPTAKVEPACWFYLYQWAKYQFPCR